MRIAPFRSKIRAFLRKSEQIAQASGLTPQRYVLLSMIKGAPDRSEQATVTRRIVVHHGRLRLSARTDPELDIVVDPDSHQPIPPEAEHEVQPLGQLRFSIDFLSILDRNAVGVLNNGDKRGGRSESAVPHALDEGGEAACWAHLLCPECGVVLDGARHAKECSFDTNP